MSEVKPPREDDPSKTLIFAVGALYGRIDLYHLMLERIKKFPLATNDKIILLGGYINGENAKDALTDISKSRDEVKCEFNILRGPWEHRFITGRRSFALAPEGVKVYNSYRYTDTTESQTWRKNFLDNELLMNDRRWCYTMPAFTITKNMFFCASGIDPSYPLKDTAQGVLMFNHAIKEFKSWSKPLSHRIIFSCDQGEEKIQISDNKINIVSNLLQTNRLSCAVMNAKTGVLEDVLMVEGKKHGPKAA